MSAEEILIYYRKQSQLLFYWLVILRNALKHLQQQANALEKIKTFLKRSAQQTRWLTRAPANASGRPADELEAIEKVYSVKI